MLPNVVKIKFVNLATCGACLWRGKCGAVPFSHVLPDELCKLPQSGSCVVRMAEVDMPT